MSSNQFDTLLSVRITPQILQRLHTAADVQALHAATLARQLLVKGLTEIERRQRHDDAAQVAVR